MSWQALQPLKSPKHAPLPVTVTVNRAAGRFQQRMVITIRPGLLAEVVPWLVGGGPVGVGLGLGADAGRYRLQANGPWKWRKAAGRVEALSVAIPAPAGAPPDGCRQVPCQHLLTDGVLVLIMPDWGAPPADAIMPAAVSNGAAANSVRPQYLGISQRVPDPAIAIQAQSGGRVR